MAQSWLKYFSISGVVRYADLNITFCLSPEMKVFNRLNILVRDCTIFHTDLQI